MSEEAIRGALRRIKFQGQDGLWCVAEVEAGDEVLTVVGTLTGVRVGEECEWRGEMVQHPRWGRQMQLQAVVPLPLQSLATVEVLQSLPGIGPVKAVRLFEAFGDDIWTIAETRPRALLDVRGISEDMLAPIRDEVLSRRADREFLLWAAARGISQRHVALTQQHFGREALAVMRDQPYRLVEVRGIGFLTADAIAQQVGIPGNSPARCEAAINYVLGEIETSEGSTVIDARLMTACLRGLARTSEGMETPVALDPPIPADVIREVVRGMREAGMLFVTDERSVQRAEARNCEMAVAKAIAEKAR